MVLVIKGHEFELPQYCEKSYSQSTDSTHIFFDLERENEYVQFAEKVCKRLGITRFGHGLGIVFSHCHIFWGGKNPPNQISLKD